MALLSKFEIVGLLLSYVSTVSEFAGSKMRLMSSMCLTSRDYKSKGLEGDCIARYLKLILQVEIVQGIAGTDDGMSREAPICH